MRSFHEKNNSCPTLLIFDKRYALCSVYRFYGNHKVCLSEYSESVPSYIDNGTSGPSWIDHGDSDLLWTDPFVLLASD